jgi:hypothetical protein
MQINVEKSEYEKMGIVYWGHKYRHGEISTVYRTETIEQWPTPRGKQKLQQFLGIPNFYRDYPPRLAEICIPLYNAL